MKMSEVLLVALPSILVLLGYYRYDIPFAIKTESKISKVALPIVLMDTIPVAVSNPQMEKTTKREIKNTMITPAFIDNSYAAFKEAVGFKESRGKYLSINTLGYMGKYQFGMETLRVLGIYDSILFMNSPDLQEGVFDANIARNKWILRKDLKKFGGRMINGIPLTESGILAAAHLAGAGNIKKFMRSNGTYIVEDAYGTSIEDYLALFADYEMSSIVPHPRPKVALKISNKTKIH